MYKLEFEETSTVKVVSILLVILFKVSGVNASSISNLSEAKTIYPSLLPLETRLSTYM